MNFDPDEYSINSPLSNSLTPFIPLNEREPFIPYNENIFYKSLYFNNKISFLEEERPTNYKTDLINFRNPKQTPKVDVYTFEKIKEIFQKNNISDLDKYILNNFIYDSDIKNAEMKLMGIKRKRSYNLSTNIDGMKYRKGRKSNSDSSQRNHHKMSSDNIIKKIKSKLFENILQFINNILNNLNSINEKKKILKDIDYKYINKIKKEFDLDLLNKSIKDILSFEVSEKFRCQKDFNKIMIEELIKNKNDNKFLIFALNMKFREWIDIYTLKKEFKEFNDTFSDDLFKSMPKVKDMIEGVFNKNKEKNYISSFIFYLYNYENWFIMKRSKKKEIKCFSSF